MHNRSYGLSTGQPDVKKTGYLRGARKTLTQRGWIRILPCSEQRHSLSSQCDSFVVFRFIKGVTL